MKLINQLIQKTALNERRRKNQQQKYNYHLIEFDQSFH